MDCTHAGDIIAAIAAFGTLHRKSTEELLELD